MKTKIFTLIVVITAILFTGCHSNEDIPNEDIPNKITPDANEITQINVYPSDYTAFSGETVDLKVEAVMSNGEIKSITEDAVISNTNDNFATVNNSSLVISNKALTGDSFNITVKYENFLEKIKIDIKNSLERNINAEGVITNSSSYDAVMNKERNLPSDYIPEDLVTLSVPTCLKNPEVNQLRIEASEALSKLFEGAKKDELKLIARSGYRSYNTQTSLYNGIVNKYGQDYADKYSAKPGQSEHQTGLAIDITADSVSLQLEDTFGDTEEGKWVKENAHKYGFIIRYPEGKESITGYEYEPWHLRYLGETLATKVYESGLTLEEYFKNN